VGVKHSSTSIVLIVDSDTKLRAAWTNRESLFTAQVSITVHPDGLRRRCRIPQTRQSLAKWLSFESPARRKEIARLHGKARPRCNESAGAGEDAIGDFCPEHSFIRSDTIEETIPLRSRRTAICKRSLGTWRYWSQMIVGRGISTGSPSFAEKIPLRSLAASIFPPTLRSDDAQLLAPALSPLRSVQSWDKPP
jgi:hypothetical protein